MGDIIDFQSKLEEKVVQTYTNHFNYIIELNGDFILDTFGNGQFKNQNDALDYVSLELANQFIKRPTKDGQSLYANDDYGNVCNYSTYMDNISFAYRDVLSRMLGIDNS